MLFAETPTSAAMCPPEENPDSTTHAFNTSDGDGTAILTFLGGFHPQTQSLWLSDIAHHHLAIAVVFIVAFVAPPA